MVVFVRVYVSVCVRIMAVQTDSALMSSWNEVKELYYTMNTNGINSIITLHLL